VPKKITLVVLLLATVPSGVHQFSLANEISDPDLCSQGIEKKVERHFRDYRVKISYADDRMCQRLEIWKSDRPVFLDEGVDNHYFLGNEDGSGDRRSILNLIGHGSQLVVKKWTGGAHCCNSLLVFDLGTQFREVSEIYAGNYEADVIDLDHDGAKEIRVLDDFLVYRFSCFASSAKSKVVLKYVAGRYAVAPELMKRPPPSWESLNAKVPQWRRALRAHSDPEWPPPALIQAMTDLLFTGNETIAFDLVDRVWPSDIAGRTDFLNSYREALAESKYYAQFKARESVH
jgi:hypothetical protein